MKEEAVGVEEDGLLVLREPPAVELGEGDAQVGSADEGEVLLVPRVEGVHEGDAVEGPLQLLAQVEGDVLGDEAVEAAGGGDVPEGGGEDERTHAVRVVGCQGHPRFRHFRLPPPLLARQVWLHWKGGIIVKWGEKGR